MEENPKEITLAKLEVIIMPNGEIICDGKTLGWLKDKGVSKYLSEFRDAITGKLINDDTN